MSHPHEQPEAHGAGHHSQTPQVAVRDGNRLLCPCCGEVLMVLKEQPPVQPSKPVPPKPSPKPAPIAMPDIEAFRKQAYDQLKAAFPSPPKRPRRKFDPSEADKGKPDPFTDHLVQPIDPLLASYEFPANNPPSLANPMNSSQNREPKRKPLVPLLRLPHFKKRKKRWRPLCNAYSYRMARHYAWTYFRLKILNVQLVGEVAAKREELKMLQLELLGPAIQSWQKENPPVESCAAAETTITSHEPDSMIDTANQHAQADLGVAPGMVGGESIDAASVEPISGMPSDEAAQRSDPPDQANDANQAHEANERGPP